MRTVLETLIQVSRCCAQVASQVNVLLELVCAKQTVGACAYNCRSAAELGCVTAFVVVAGWIYSSRRARATQRSNKSTSASSLKLPAHAHDGKPSAASRLLPVHARDEKPSAASRFQLPVCRQLGIMLSFCFKWLCSCFGDCATSLRSHGV